MNVQTFAEKRVRSAEEQPELRRSIMDPETDSKRKRKTGPKDEQLGDLESREQSEPKKPPQKKKRSKRRRISLEQLRAQFVKPLAEAAKALGIGISTLKRLCRENSILRWPHRSLSSVSPTIESDHADPELSKQLQEQSEEQKDLEGSLNQRSSATKQECKLEIQYPPEVHNECTSSRGNGSYLDFLSRIQHEQCCIGYNSPAGVRDGEYVHQSRQFTYNPVAAHPSALSADFYTRDQRHSFFQPNYHASSHQVARLHNYLSTRAEVGRSASEHLRAFAQGAPMFGTPHFDDYRQYGGNYSGYQRVIDPDADFHYSSWMAYQNMMWRSLSMGMPTTQTML